MIIIFLIIGFFAGCVLTWLSMLNSMDASYNHGYAKGFSDAKRGLDAE